MPYKLEKSGSNWVVRNTETGKVKGTHKPPDAKEKAQKQMKLLYALKNPSFKPRK